MRACSIHSKTLNTYRSLTVFKGENYSSVSLVPCHLSTLDFAVQTNFVFYCLCHLLAESRPGSQVNCRFHIYTESAHWSFWMQSSLLVVLNTCDSNLCQHMTCQVCKVSRMLLSFKPGTSAKMHLEELRALQINRFGLTLKVPCHKLWNQPFGWLWSSLPNACPNEGPNLCIKMQFCKITVITFCTVCMLVLWHMFM